MLLHVDTLNVFLREGYTSTPRSTQFDSLENCLKWLAIQELQGGSSLVIDEV